MTNVPLGTRKTALISHNYKSTLRDVRMVDRYGSKLRVGVFPTS